MKCLVTVCICVIFALFLGSISCAEIDPETCVGMWLFNKGDGQAFDSTPNGNNGKFVSEPKLTEGRFGKGLELDGVDDYVEVADSESLDAILNEGMTIVAWVLGEYRPADWHGIVTKAADWEVDMCYLLQRNANGLFEFAPFSQNFDQVWVPFTQPEDGIWYHVAAVYDGTKASIYVDGEFGASSPYALGIADTDAPLIIGSNYPSNIQCINGILDEVAIFSVALEQEDIQTIMNEGLEAATGISAMEPVGKLVTTWAQIRSK